jgi:hypothetical protein
MSCRATPEVDGANDAGRFGGLLLLYHQRLFDRCQLGTPQNCPPVSEEASATDLSRIHYSQCGRRVSGGTHGGRFSHRECLSLPPTIRMGLHETAGHSTARYFVPAKPFACRERIDLINRL